MIVAGHEGAKGQLGSRPIGPLRNTTPRVIYLSTTLTQIDGYHHQQPIPVPISIRSARSVVVQSVFTRISGEGRIIHISHARDGYRRRSEEVNLFAT